MQQTEHTELRRRRTRPASSRTGGPRSSTIGDAEVGRLVFAAGLALVERRASRSPAPRAARRRTSSTTSAASSAIRMDDGTEFVAGPGDVTSLPSGHDAWVVGDEPVVVVDWFGASNYAKTASQEG